MTEQQTGSAAGGATITPEKEQKFPLMLAPSKFGGMVLKLESFEQVWRLATIFAGSGPMVPEIYRNNAHGAAMAILWGQELDISPIQAIQGIAVIGGKPSVWGDLAVALILRHPAFDGSSDGRMLDEAGNFLGWYFELRRKGLTPVRREFTLKNAEAAGLLGKTPAWKGSPERMCFNRARAFAQRDLFADALRGLSLADETQDFIDLPADRWSERTPNASSPPVASEPMPQPKRKEPPLSEPSGNTSDPAASSPLDFADLETPGDLEMDADGAGSLHNPELFEELFSSASPAAQGTPPQACASGAGDSRKPLTRGRRMALDAALKAVESLGLTEQSVVDQLGDSVHMGNIDAALAWLAAQSAK